MYHLEVRPDTRLMLTILSEDYNYITYCFNKAVRENHLLIAAHLQMKLMLGLIACYHPSLVVNEDPHQENNDTKP